MSSYPFKAESSAEPGWVAKDKPYATPDQCEPLSRYMPGGLPPILLGDIIKGTDLTRPDQTCSFEIIAKLGFGSSSTVWLGKNTTAEQGGYLALKVLESRLSGRGDENPELCMLQKLGRLRTAFMYEHPGLGLEADQSRFLVLGMEPLGQRFDHRDILDRSDDEDEEEDGDENEDEDEDEDVDKDNPDRKYDNKTALAKTILTKVLELHEKGICHNNLDPSSLAYGLRRDAFKPDVLEDKLLDEQRELHVILEGVDESALSGIQRPAHLPKHLISHNDGVWGSLKSNWKDKTIVDLMGFGKAFNISESSPLYQGQDEHYTAPEVLQDGKPANLQSDLWSLGCLIFYALARRHLFNPDYTAREVRDKIYENYTKEFDADSQHFFIRANFLSMWDQKYKDLVTRLVRCLLRPDPADRDVEAAKEIIKEMEDYTFDPKYKSTLVDDGHDGDDGFSDSDEDDYDDDDDEEGPIDLLAEIRAMALKENGKDT